MNTNDQALLKLLALGLGHSVPFDIPLSQVDWPAVTEQAQHCGLDAIAFDGVQALYERQPELAEALEEALGEHRFDWLGFTMQVEQDYDAYRRTLRDLAAFFNGAGLPVMVLKGYGLSLNYPEPRHRPTGDIDIYLFGRWKEADHLLEAQLGVEIGNAQHHHSTFRYGGRLVENHYDLINIHSRPSNRRLEPLLKELAGRSPVEWVIAADDSADCARAAGDPAETSVPEGAANILLPGADFNALFLLRHAAGHFASIDISLRHVLDWLLFVQCHGAEVDWPWLYGVLERENMVHFANSLNAIGVRYLGFEPSLFPALESDGALVDRILGEIMHPAFQDREDGKFFHSLWVKLSRWWTNRWKYRLCYADSLFAAFFHSLFAKVLRPRTFIH